MAFCYDRSPCSSFPIPTGKHLLQPCTPSLYTMLQMLHDQRFIQPKYYILMPSNDRLYLVISDFDLVCCQELKVYGHSFIHSFIHSGDLWRLFKRLLRSAPSPVTDK